MADQTPSAWFQKISIWGSQNTIKADLGQIGEGRDSQFLAWLEGFKAPERELPRFPKNSFSPNRRDELMGNPTLQACFNSKSQTFVLIGKAGVGKTTTVQGILTEQSGPIKEGNVAVASMFFSWSRIEWNDPSRVMMRLLAQYVDQLRDRIPQARHLFELHAPDCPPAEDTATALVAVLQDQIPACVIIDAVDECKQQLEGTLELLLKIQQEARIGIILTDRLDEEGMWKQYFPKAHVEKFDTAEDKDLRMYIQRRIKNSNLRATVSNNDMPRLEKSIMELSSRNFLWLRCNMDFLISRDAADTSSLNKDLKVLLKNSRRNTSPPRYTEGQKEYVQEIHQSLLEEYLGRIAPLGEISHGGQLAQTIIRFVRDAARPLTVPELETIVAWDTRSSSIDASRHRPWDNIRRICLGLIEANESSAGPVVQFYHPTFQLLLRDPDFQQRLPNAHGELGEVCLQYLSQPIFSSGACRTEAELEKRISDYPLLGYAAEHWKTHFGSAVVADCAQQASLHESALTFLRSDPNVEFSVQLAPDNDPVLVNWSSSVHNFAMTTFEGLHRRHIGRDTRRHRPAFHYRCEHAENIERFPPNKATGLHVASWHGFDFMVEALLKAQKAFECRDRGLQTPLHVAAAANKPSIVNILLDHGADPDAKDIFGYSPLLSAIQNGAIDVVNAFLDPDIKIDVNARTTSRCSTPGQTGLHLAVQENHDNIVTALLTRDGPDGIDCKVLDTHGETPCHLAVRLGNEKIVKLLTKADKAASQLCVGQGPNYPQFAPGDFNGRTSLHLACMNNRDTEVVKYLLRHLHTDCNPRDYQKKTPLHCAVEAEAVGSVDVLLRRDDIDVNARDHQDQSPIFAAVLTRNLEIFNLIWNVPDLAWDFLDARGFSLIQHAQRCGNETICDLINQRSQPSSHRDSLELSPVHSAASSPRKRREIRNSDGSDTDSPTSVALRARSRRVSQQEDFQTSPSDDRRRTPAYETPSKPASTSLMTPPPSDAPTGTMRQHSETSSIRSITPTKASEKKPMSPIVASTSMDFAGKASAAGASSRGGRTEPGASRPLQTQGQSASVEKSEKRAGSSQQTTRPSASGQKRQTGQDSIRKPSDRQIFKKADKFEKDGQRKT